jgi:hypothetical protein
VDGERIIIITAKLGLLLLKRMKDYGINPLALHGPFIPFPFLLDRTKPKLGFIIIYSLNQNSHEALLI